jgi:hypothetical protein
MINLLSLLSIFLYSADAYAKEYKKFRMEMPIEKKMIEEEEYSFFEQEYAPPYELDLLTAKNKKKNESPEAALAMYFASILEGDVDGVVGVMSKNEGKSFRNKTTEEQFTKMSALKKQADVLLKSRAIKLNKKYFIDNKQLIIDYTIYNISDNSKILDWIAIVVFENNTWRVCGECGSKPSDALYPILVNKNYKFIGREKRIARDKIITPKPSAPFINIDEKARDNERTQPK